MNEIVTTTQVENTKPQIKPIVKLEREVAKFAHEALMEISKEWHSVQAEAQRIIRAGEVKLGIAQKEIAKAISEKNPEVSAAEGVNHAFDLRYMDTHGEVYVHQAQLPTSAAPQPTASVETPTTVSGTTN